MDYIYYATGNAGKFDEVRDFAALEAPDISIEQYDQELDELQSMNQKEIAINKALQAYNLLQKPVLVDDSGIYFNKYHEFPGTMTKFVYQGIGFEGLLKLIEPGDSATFLLTLVYCYGPNQYECFEGRCDGIIKYDPSFKAPPSLPYDLIFSPENTNKTYGELRALGQLHTYNYRIQAFKKFLAWYEDR